MGSEIERPLLEEGTLENGIQQQFTGDGSVDIHGNPSLKPQSGNWRACPFILGTECCERLAYFGIGMNLVTYLTQKLHQGNVSAARNVTTWKGTCCLTPLIGATLADANWGRYWTIAVFSTIYFAGMSILTASVSIPALRPPPCIGTVCPEATAIQYGLIFLGLYMIALGSGGIKPCVMCFGADQFDNTDSNERLAKGSFFNWFYLSINVGGLVSSSVLVWVQDNYGWGLGFAIPTLFMGLAIALFFSATPLYRFCKPGGSPLTRVCQVLVASVYKSKVDVPCDSSLLYELPEKASAIEGSQKLEHSVGFEFLDKAATITDIDTKTGSCSNPWRLCTVTQVEELKILLRMFPIWVTCVVFAVLMAQFALFIKQGMVLNKMVGSFSIPPASMVTVDVIAVIVWVPIYDRIVVPVARKFTGNERGFSTLQRMGIGLFISMFGMVAAAMVEAKRLHMANVVELVHPNSAAQMSILWQLPQYFLIGTAEIFVQIGLLEFFYDQSPDSMRSLCNAFALLTAAAGNYLSSLIITIVTFLTSRGGKAGWITDNLNEGHLDYYFWLLAGISFTNLLVYVSCARRYKYKRGL